MAEVNAHVGEHGIVEVEIHDAQGNVTTDWDIAGGVKWSSTNEVAVPVSDMDLNPQDAEVEFAALTGEGEEVFIECQFDGRVGPEEKPIMLRSQSIAVVPGEATSGVVNIRMVPVEPPA